MKCRICGYELDGTTVFCPMCGSKVEASDIAAMQAPAKETEFSWKTYDFPKPRQMRDIKMEWNGSGVMNDDASEGFVQTDISPFTSSSRQAAPEKPSFTAAPTVSAMPLEGKPADTVSRGMQFEQPLPVWHMPEQKVADNTPLWATQPLWDAGNLPQSLQDASIPEPQMFTARGYITTMPAPAAVKDAPVSEKPEASQTSYEKTPEKFNTFYRKNDEFQKLLDQEYERARLLRRETAPQTTLNSAYTPQASVEAAELSAFEEMLRAGTKAEDELGDNTMVLNIDHVHRGLDDLFSVGEFGALEELENMEKTMVVEKAKPTAGADEAPAAETPVFAPEKPADPIVDTAELEPVTLSDIFEKAESVPDTADPVSSAESVAADAAADAAEAYLPPLSESILSARHTAPSEVEAALEAMILAESEEKAPSENLKNTLDDILSELKEKDDSLDTVRVRNTIEMRIREIREREEMNKRLVMQQAREAYFNAIDEVNGKTVARGLPDETIPSSAEAVPNAAASAAPANEGAAEAPANAAPAEASAEPAGDQKKGSPDAVPAAAKEQDYDKLLTEIMKQEPEEPRRERSHWFGKLLIAIIVILVVLEAVIMGLKYFIPDHEITKIAILGEEMVIELCKEWYARTVEFIQTFIQEHITGQ